MKKKNIFYSVCMTLLSAIACVLGGAGLATDEPNVRNYGDTDPDPNANTPLEDGVKTTPTDKGGIAQHGHDANASVLQQVGLLNNKMFRKVVEYHAQVYPFYSDVFTKATQFSFKGHKEAEYPEVGDIKTESRLQTAINNGTAKKHKVDLTVPAADAAIFRKNYTIIVPSVKGYDEDGHESEENLMLYVTKNDDSGYPEVMAINGPIGTDGETYVPNIESGALLMLAAPALAEEEVEVDPLNIIPSTRKAYLQKKGYSVAITDFFSEAVKEVDWEKDRVKRQTLDAYKKLYTTTTLFGVRRKFYKRTKNGMRICYTQEGTINQLRMMYQLNGGKVTKGDLIAISKMLFSTYTDATVIDVYMGSDFTESLLNIDWGEDVQRIVYLDDEVLKIKVASLETPYGTLRFKHEKSFTQHHLEKAAIALPMEDSMRIYRDNGSTYKVDGKKGETGQVEELTKEFFVQDDCFIVNSMASMLIGTTELFAKGYGAGIVESFKSVTSLPNENCTKGDKVYLTELDGNYDRGLYEYDGSAWIQFNRGIEA